MTGWKHGGTEGTEKRVNKEDRPEKTGRRQRSEGGRTVGRYACIGDSVRLPAMALSARNQFPGKVVSIKAGAVMAEVVIDIGGGHQIVSLISAGSAKRLRLKK